MNQLRVLLVEDDSDDVELTRWSLGQIGIDQIEVAMDGAQAMDLLRNRPLPGLVLLDLRLPLVDGLEVLARLRSDPELKAIPVAVLTSSENPLDRTACLALGVAAYLSKPLDGAVLKAVLD
jgi:two-component system response regulator